MDFNARMTALSGALSRSPKEALALAESLETDLLAAPKSDPTELGWARDYRIRSLYRLGRHREGLSLLTTPPPRVMTMRSGNAAWLHSVGAEMAVRSGSPELCRGLIRKALDLRIIAGERDGVRMAVETGVVLLREAGLSAEVDGWLDEVEERAFSAPAGSDEATMLGEALAHAAATTWFPGSLPSAERRRAEMVLHGAVMAGDVAEVRRRLADGVNPGARHIGWSGMPTPLLAASFKGHVEIVQALLEQQRQQRVNLEARTIQGRTALHHAADQDHAAIVDLLCEAGARRDVQDFRGQTPLHVASWQGHLASVEALVAASASLELRDINGDTALAIAATEPVPSVVQCLLAASADREAENTHGQTPLIRAAMDGQAEIVAILLSAGAAVDHRDRNGRSALDWARAEGHSAVVALLDRREVLGPRGRRSTRRR
jgi:ankyrin repeat protein